MTITEMQKQAGYIHFPDPKAMSLPVRATVLVTGDSADILIHDILLLLTPLVLRIVYTRTKI